MNSELLVLRVKNSIVAAGNAIAGSLDSFQGGDQQAPGAYGYPNEYYPHPPPSSYQQRTGGYESSYDRRSVPDTGTGKNLVGKLKSFFGSEPEQQHIPVPHEYHSRYQHPSPTQQLPQQLGNTAMHHAQSQRAHPDSLPQTVFSGYQEQSYPRGPGELVESVRESGGELSQYGSLPNIPPQYSQQPREDAHYAIHNVPPGLPHSRPSHQPPLPSRPPHEEMLERMPAEPQVLIHEDNVVMILKPKEFYRKKYALITGGSNNLQVFTDFEHAFTKFKSDSPCSTPEKPVTERSLSTLELLEMSGALSPEALQRIQQLTNEYDQKFYQLLNEEGNSSDATLYQLYEEMSAQYQLIIAKFGNLYSGNVLPATKELLSRIALRQGWKESLQALGSKGVPTFIFSSGFGDIITNIMLLNDLTETNPTNQYGASRQGPSQVIPNNIRIISNFFRTAPDYSVRAFSQPIVHDKNKNCTTAEKLMGMPIPSRPNALVNKFMFSNQNTVSLPWLS